MKKIPLSQGQEAIVDDWWFDYLMQWKWWAWWNRDTHSFYAVGKMGGSKNIYMHRVVAQTHDGMICDHIHHNTLDNREEELRNVTHSQSLMNTKIYSNNKLGTRGVRHRKNGYQAVLNIKGKQVLCKTFRTFEEAKNAYDDASKKYFGEFAYK